ncbi:phosphate acetyltransferase [Thermocoleostomius sinensis]|uniref:Phosphate acetyltransferase n=1 Tax=Thermocoleostomius sinensis A174 TaxID=2016057 RepID=A0A9E9C5W7_9CYAN|nr:phosphate acetyltransferase [Thermocoleostomius sinensis]WAL61621.1 phosphate acetyltransferase [Thermocoleostomius sinensis A174]
MTNNLYIAAIEPGSGKSLVLLGMIELLSKRVEKLGFFRPVIHNHPEQDNDMVLVRSRYQIELPYESQYALTAAEARQLIANGQTDELLKRVITAYKALERQCQFVVCEGCDSTDIDPAFIDNFNSLIASHLAIPILLVANGHEKQPEEVISTVKTARDVFVEAGCSIVATFVNRVFSPQQDEVVSQLQKVWSYAEPVFVLPEDDTLAKPTMAEIAKALNGQLIYGEPEHLNREISGFKAAAMQVPNFLSHVEDGSLVITPGDRADILLACLATSFSDHYPPIAGVVLTGGLSLPPTIRSLIDGFSRWTMPIVQVASDTYETATQVNAVRAELTPDNERKIALALGIFESYVDTSKIEERISISRSDRITPIMFEYELIERAKSAKQHIVLPEGKDERILRASEILLRRGVVDITLLGNESEIREQIAVLGLDLDGVAIIDPLHSDLHDDYAATYFELRKHKGITQDFARDMMHDVSYFGTMMVYKDAANGMVSGALHTTAHTIRPALEFIRTQPGCSIVSSVFLMCLDDRVLVYGDCAVNPNPNPQQLADIAISSAETATLFGINPLVAMLSYSTGESGKGADVDKVKEATQLVRQRSNLKIEGPIQYDAAIDERVAQTKLPGSQVAGHATVFVFPDLNTGNNTYKAVQRSANAVAIGPILQGLRKPVNDLSRGCTVTDIVNTVAITAIQAQAMTANSSPTR